LNQYSQTQSFIMLMYLGVILLAFSCGYPSSDGDSDTASASLPKDIWTPHALEVILACDSQKEWLKLYGEIQEQSALTTLFFNEKKQIYKILIEDGSQFIHHYYFQDGLLSFSSHLDKKKEDARNWLIAYAQNKPYTAATGIFQNEIHEADLAYIPINGLAVTNLVNYARSIEKSEKAEAMSQRLLASKEVRKDILEGETDKIFTRNVRKGEELRIKLDAKKQHLFFTISPNNGSNMEYRYWEGMMKHTGDIKITVFSSEEIKTEAFTLTVEPY